jgi:hypothetical protein
MEDLNLTSSSEALEPPRDQPVDLTTQPENGVAEPGPPQRYFQLVAVINHMQWLLNCYTNRSLLGPHLTAFRRDVFAMAETTSVLTADPQVLAYTLGYKRILRALTLQNQLGQLLAQMEERASTLLLPTSPLPAPSTQFSFSPRQIQQNQSEDRGLTLGTDDATSSSSEAPMPLLFRPRAAHPEIVSRGAVAVTGILPIGNSLPLHRPGSQSFSSSGSAQESDNLSKPPTFEQKYRPPPAPSLESPGLPTAPGDHRLLATPPDIVTRALEENGALRVAPSFNSHLDRPPSLLVDLEEVINRLEGEPPSAVENLNPPPDPPWGDHREADPQEPLDIIRGQRYSRWARS